MNTSWTLCFILGLGLLARVAPAQRLARAARPTTVAQLLRQVPAVAPGLRRGTSTTVLRPGQVVSYDYDATTQRWVDPVINTLLYDGAGRLAQQAQMDSATAAPLNRRFITYNAAGQLTETRDQFYLMGSYSDYYREVLTYDARRQLVERQQQTPNGPTAWRTESGERYLNTYDAANGLTAQTVQVYRPATSAYADSAHYLFALATPGGPWTTRIIQDPDGRGGWLNAERDRNAVWYDFEQQQLAGVVAQGWTGTAWQTETRLRGTYTATTAEAVVQDSTAGGWTNAQRQYSSFDPTGNLLNAQIGDWSGTAWSVVLEVRYQYAYNPDQSLRRSVQSLDFGGSGLALFELKNYSQYQSIVLAGRAAAAGTAQAYPNPSPDGRFTLLLSTPAPAGEVRVLDALGREVARDAWAGTARSSYALNLSAQPAGLYSVSVQTAAGRIVQRLSIR